VVLILGLVRMDLRHLHESEHLRGQGQGAERGNKGHPGLTAVILMRWYNSLELIRKLPELANSCHHQEVS
jgi:hypothetical protein